VGLGLLCLTGRTPARAQVLAQRNWAGSGVSVEPWWRRGVFYRIDPEMFQDSDGDGKGDVAGVTQRLDYLQSLGVDALILKSARETDPATATLTVEGFDDLARAAVGRHLRVLVELGAPASQSADAAYVALARQWLNQGAAGIYVPTQALEKMDGAAHIALLLHQLRVLTNSFPGGRVLLADAPATADQDLVSALSTETNLTASAAIGSPASGSAAGGSAAVTAASLRAQWTAALGGSTGSAQTALAQTVPAATAAVKAQVKVPVTRRRHVAAAGENDPLLVAVRVPAEMSDRAKAGLERALAVMLLGSRAAVMLEYGQELGLDAGEAGEPRMQWTPTNVTRKPEPVAAPKETGPTYQAFRAYIPPPPRNLLPPPTMPVVIESDEAVPVVIDPNTLPGFTAGTLDAAPTSAHGATANVAVEQADPKSLLNLYRQMIELHHDNATVRNGAETVLDYDAMDAVVWVRQAPASSRTSANVVAACNLSDRPVVLGDFGGLRLRGLRSLLSPEPEGALLTVAPGAVMVGEAR